MRDNLETFTDEDGEWTPVPDWKTFGVLVVALVLEIVIVVGLGYGVAQILRVLR